MTFAPGVNTSPTDSHSVGCHNLEGDDILEPEATSIRFQHYRNDSQKKFLFSKQIENFFTLFAEKKVFFFGNNSSPSPPFQWFVQ
jgi:hypothetical protein